jgi:hypothetical protein
MGVTSTNKLHGPVVRKIAKPREKEHVTMAHNGKLGSLLTFEGALEPVTQAFKEKSLKRPFDEDSIRNASHHGGFENWYRVHRVLQKLLDKKGLTILVLGGSITCGSAFQSFGKMRMGTSMKGWVQLLGDLLNHSFHDHFGEIQVINKCHRGTTHKYALQQVGDFPQVDLVISEYHFNEFGLDFIPRRELGRSRAEQNTTLRRATRQLMSMVMAWPTKPAFMFIDLPRWHEDTDRLHGHVRDEAKDSTVDWLQVPAVASGHWPIAAEFHVPLLWYPDAVRASGSLNMPEDQEELLHNLRHPEYGIAWAHPAAFPGHHITAALVYGTLYRELLHVAEHGVLGEDSQLPTMDAEETAMTECIANPQLQATAVSGAEAFNVDASFSTWTFFEDVRGKPGWIAEPGPPRTIVFKNINVKKGTVKIGYLRSYEHFGDAKCQLKAGTAPQAEHLMEIKMHGSWESFSSQIDFAALTGVAPGTYDLSCLSGGKKFKIVSLMTC